MDRKFPLSALLLTLAAVFLGLLLAAASLGGPGAWLFERFGLWAWAFPVYALVQAGLQVRPPATRSLDWVSHGLWLPVLTLTLWGRVLGGGTAPLEAALTERFGISGASWFLGLLVAVETLLLGLLALMGPQDPPRRAREALVEFRESRPSRLAWFWHQVLVFLGLRDPELGPAEGEAAEAEAAADGASLAGELNDEADDEADSWPVPSRAALPQAPLPPEQDIRRDPFWDQPLPSRTFVQMAKPEPEVVPWEALGGRRSPQPALEAAESDEDILSEEELVEEEAAQALEAEWNQGASGSEGEDPGAASIRRLFDEPEEDDAGWAESVARMESAGGAGDSAPTAAPSSTPERRLPPGTVLKAPGRLAAEAAAAQAAAAERERSRPRYHVPMEGILQKYNQKDFGEIDEPTRRAAQLLKTTLDEFNIQAEVTGIRKGPVITMFEILPAPGVKLSRIVGLADNIALGLAAQSVRIVAPIPGKHAVGIEVPNRERGIVGFGEMVASPEFTDTKAEVPIVLGKGISGDTQIIDLAKTPHLLIAGSTGSGKSVSVNSLICSILYKRSPQEVKLILIDPKIVELKFFNGIPHLLAPVITEPKKALQAIQWALFEMERRYALLDTFGVRDIKSFNLKVEKKALATTKLPYIVVVVDEFADLMATSGKELEGTLARLAAMSRAVGIHLVLATQRPSIDVITGLIKANFPSRIAFMVASKTDSRIIIDSVGAEKLLGRGDMLFTSSWDPFPQRIQGAYLSEDEVERVVTHVKTLGEPEYIEDEMFYDDEEAESPGSDWGAGDDPLWDKAVEVVVQSRKASASYLQRRLSIGYNRAARLVEEMEQRGIVGPQNGSKAREILNGVM